MFLVYFKKQPSKSRPSSGIHHPPPLNGLLLLHSGHAQNTVWLNGNSELRFVQNGVCDVEDVALPQPNDPNAQGYQYEGLPALYSEQMILDQYGQRLAFLIDGRIYDREGYMVADSEEEPNCQYCLPKGITEAVAVPIPGRCYMYYVFIGVLGEGSSCIQCEFSVKALVLDLSRERPSCNDCFNAGRVGEVLEDGDYALDGLNWPVGTNTNQFSSYLFDIPVHQGDEGFYLAGQFSALDLGYDQDKWLFVLGHRRSPGDVSEKGINRYRISDQGMELKGVEDYPDDITWQQGLGYEEIFENTKRPYGEVDVVQVGSEIRMAYNLVSQFYPDNLPNAYRHYIRIHRYDLSGIAIGDDLVLIDQFEPSSSDPEKGPYSSINGVEFSPDGAIIYYLKPYAELNGIFGSVNVATQQVTQSTHDLTDFRHSQLEVAPSSADPNELSIYAIADDGRVGELANPNAPLLSTWNPQAFQLPVAYLCEGPNDAEVIASDGTTLPYYTIENGARTIEPYGPQPAELCCNEMVMAEGWNVTAALGTNYWLHGSNPFHNTCAPVIVRGTIRIPAGADVIVNDMEFRFAPEANVIIEPSARLKLNNCLLTSACEERWQGIIVTGQGQLTQVASNQGRLNLYEGTTIENAVIGVLVADESFGSSSGGGIVLTKNATFRNNRFGIYFRPYQNFDPNTLQKRRNVSRIRQVEFTIDENYFDPNDFITHVLLWRVDGIPFLGCSFQNTRQDQTESHKLGNGIYSLDAGYRVDTDCASIFQQGGTCPTNDIIRTDFTGLDHGIHAAVALTARRFSVVESDFNNNICGVYTETMPGFTVADNVFNIGDRDVALTGIVDNEFEGRHRGIFSSFSYNFRIQDNHFKGSTAPNAAPAEGVVVGNSNGHNNVIFRNTGEDLHNAFVGEGICSDVNNKTHIGLQFICNTNLNNQTGLFSRELTGGQIQPADQCVRTRQGSTNRPADNEFDLAPGLVDFKSTTWGNVISYSWADPAIPYKPDNYTLTYVVPDNTGVTRPAQNCTYATIPIADPDKSTPVTVQSAVWDLAFATGMSDYANTRYLYEQLIDGGNTDGLVQEVQMSWPSDAWELHAMLMAESPFLSQEVLMETVMRNVLPQAMLAEVLVANPSATKERGFLEWLQFESGYPLPQYMIDQVMASWQSENMRSLLEDQMGEYHARMSFALMEQTAVLSSDSIVDYSDSVMVKWESIHTLSGDYAKALYQLQNGDLNAAETTTENMDLGAKPTLAMVDEKARMSALLAFYQGLDAEEKQETELGPGDITALQNIINDAYDRPACWAQNLLCFGYGICRPPITGEGSSHGPSIQMSNSIVDASDALSLQPNPGANWTAVNYNIQARTGIAFIVLRDMRGRELQRHNVGDKTGQLVLDLREISAGMYSIELVDNDHVVESKKLVVKRSR